MDTPVTPEQVTLQLRQQLPISGAGAQLAFYGGSFTALKAETQEKLLAAAQPFLADGSLESIRISTRPDAISVDTVDRLKQFRVSIVELGCQSLDDDVLKLSGRGHTAMDTIKAFELLRSSGVNVILQMMTGLPGDDGTASRYTAKTIADLHPQGVRIYPTVVLKDTELERQMKRGAYLPQTVEEAVELCAELYELFLAADIPVIRLGLNPTEDLSAGEAVAGAYDSALGERVLSRMYLHRAQTLLKNEKNLKNPVFCVHPRRVSVMIGQKKENIRALEKQYHTGRIRISPEAQDLWGIYLKSRT